MTPLKNRVIAYIITQKNVAWVDFEQTSGTDLFLEL
jgi:hypothetical protein